jgi:phosphate uptake regulator
MSRAAYCRSQAVLCREMARLMSDHQSVARLHMMARHYEVEADHLEGVRSQKGESGDNDNVGPI